MRYLLSDTQDSPLIKAARPIPSNEIINFWNSLTVNTGDSIFDYGMIQKFKETYSRWIQSSNSNHLLGLENYPHTTLTQGTSESFNIFWAKHSKRRARFFKAEFVLHKLICRNNKISSAFLEDDVIRENDAVIISLPFSDLGGEHPKMKHILDACDELDVPVLIDCAYMVIAKNIDFDFNRKCIEVVTFSLSKGFWAVDKLRCGIRFQKVDDDDAIDIANSWGTLNLISLTIAYKLITSFGPDYNWTTFGQKYEAVIKKYSLMPTNCILFALGGDDYKEFNRGGNVSRICVANALNDIPGHEL